MFYLLSYSCTISICTKYQRKV